MKSEKSLTYQNYLNAVTLILNEQSKQWFDAMPLKKPVPQIG